MRVENVAAEELARTYDDKCTFCGHDPHDGAFCKGRSRCDCGDSHACACSHPDPANHVEVPE